MSQEKDTSQNESSESPPKRQLLDQGERATVVQINSGSSACEKELDFTINGAAAGKICLSPYCFSVQENLNAVLYDVLPNFQLSKGVIVVNADIVIHYHFRDNNELEFYVMSIQSRRMIHSSTCALTNQLYHSVIPNGPEGGNWEGDSVSGKPCGWGCSYSKEHELMYEGFRVDDTNIGYGTLYHADGRVKYKGLLCEGEPYGEGVFFNGSGERLSMHDFVLDSFAESSLVVPVFKGGSSVSNNASSVSLDESSAAKDASAMTPISNDNAHTTPKDNPTSKPISDFDLETNLIKTPLIHSRVRSLLLDSNVGNDICAPICFSCFRELTTLTIGASSFRQATGFLCQWVPALTTITIGEKCFTMWEKWTRPPSESRATVFALDHCDNLTSLAVGRYSFSDFSSCHMRDLPALQTLSFGEMGLGARCFSFAPLSLTRRFNPFL